MASFKRMVGMVVSAATEKTVLVSVDRLYVHSRIRKICKSQKKFKAHDEFDICHVGTRNGPHTQHNMTLVHSLINARSHPPSANKHTHKVYTRTVTHTHAQMRSTHMR